MPAGGAWGALGNGASRWSLAPDEHAASDGKHCAGGSRQQRLMLHRAVDGSGKGADGEALPYESREHEREAMPEAGAGADESGTLLWSRSHLAHVPLAASCAGFPPTPEAQRCVGDLAVPDFYFLAVLGGQMLSGLLIALGVIIGLRLALPSLARTLARELDAARRDRGQDSVVDEDAGRPVVTLHPRDEVGNG